MRFGVIVFPGTWSDRDFEHALGAVLGHEVERVWHEDTDLSSYDCMVAPGGFSYGDYLRAGAIARFAPVMGALERYAADGKPVIGSCNGFQVLCEAGLLPGALVRNEHLEFRCEWTHLRAETTASPFTSRCAPGQVLRVPIAHGEGRYYADEATLADLNDSGRVAFRYCTPSRRRDGGVEPQRLAAEHRRHPERRTQRPRPHAAPRALLRVHPRRRGRPPHPRIHRGQRRPLHRLGGSPQPPPQGEHLKPLPLWRPLQNPVKGKNAARWP